METNEVSQHQVLVFRCMKGCGWLTGAEIAKKSGVVPRTVRAHLLKLVNLGLLDVAEVFPAHRYRISEKAEKRNASYIKRLDAAAEVFGLSVA